ncbi:hypothetical protein SZ55_4426 [Pseudomonas sp. FeS53a]|nr:hypothetical protein SZ55_4426 [Pseudomonas sp. FeS53a]
MAANALGNRKLAGEAAEGQAVQPPWRGATIPPVPARAQRPARPAQRRSRQTHTRPRWATGS